MTAIVLKDMFCFFTIIDFTKFSKNFTMTKLYKVLNSS